MEEFVSLSTTTTVGAPLPPANCDLPVENCHLRKNDRREKTARASGNRIEDTPHRAKCVVCLPPLLAPPPLASSTLLSRGTEEHDLLLLLLPHYGRWLFFRCRAVPINYKHGRWSSTSKYGRWSFFRCRVAPILGDEKNRSKTFANAVLPLSCSPEKYFLSSPPTAMLVLSSFLTDYRQAFFYRHVSNKFSD